MFLQGTEFAHFAFRRIVRTRKWVGFALAEIIIMLKINKIEFSEEYCNLKIPYLGGVTSETVDILLAM